MKPQDPFTGAGWAAWGIVAVLLILVPAYCHQAKAQDSSENRDTPVFDCKQLTETVAPFTDFRDVGVPVDQVIAELRKAVADAIAARPVRFEVIEREIRRLWADKLPAADAARQLYQRCRQQRGDMGRSV